MSFVALAKKVGLLDPKLAWFNIRIAPIIENDEASIHWNIKMATHTTFEHRWPDLRVEWKKKQLIEVFDMVCPLDCNVIEKEKEKRMEETSSSATTREDKTPHVESSFTH